MALWDPLLAGTISGIIVAVSVRFWENRRRRRAILRRLWYEARANRDFLESMLRRISESRQGATPQGHPRLRQYIPSALAWAAIDDALSADELRLHNRETAARLLQDVRSTLPILSNLEERAASMIEPNNDRSWQAAFRTLSAGEESVERTIPLLEAILEWIESEGEAPDEGEPHPVVMQDLEALAEEEGNGGTEDEDETGRTT